VLGRLVPDKILPTDQHGPIETHDQIRSRDAQSADSIAHARVIVVWEGIRRTHGAPPDQAAPAHAARAGHRPRRLPNQQDPEDPAAAQPNRVVPARDRALLLVGLSPPCDAARWPH
jgi:hypothetical protein